MKIPSRGLYVLTRITDQNESEALGAVRQALLAGAGMVQYRDKRPCKSPSLARSLKALCQAFNVPLIVNDDLALAREVAADGVHLGRDDGEIAEARRILGGDVLIGVSCYDDLDRALDAARQGADYVAFGCFYPSETKPGAPPARLSTLTWARQALTLPVVAIGGIKPDNGRALLEAGSDWLAVSGGVFDGDVYRSCQSYLALFG